MRKLNLQIPEESLIKEFNTIQLGRENGYSTMYSWNEIVLCFQWKEFYKQELQLWQENKMRNGLPLQSWIYLNRMKYINKDANTLTDREILRAFKITGIHIGNSFHSPFYIQQFIKDYDIKSIYDMTGGWGHRLLGAWNIPYIYNDINQVTYDNTKRMSDYLKLENKIFYNNDSSTFTPTEDYDAVFTCPPYGNLEKYSDKGAENLSYKDFLLWWHESVKHSIKPSCRYFAFIINHTYKEDMEKVCTDLGLNKINEIVLGKQHYSHLKADCRDGGKKSEYLIVFKSFS